MTNWFDVDRIGLAQVLARRGKAFVVFELIANAWDEVSTTVDVTLKRIPGTPYAWLRVEDDNPQGFIDLTHAWTLFAPSPKKANPEQAGRFDIGEKLALACCRRATITSTTGTVIFDETGRRRTGGKRERGSVVEGEVRLTTDEIEDCTQAVMRLLPPARATTSYNGQVIPSRTPLTVAEADLPTEVADADGNMRRTHRKTSIEIYEPLPGETAALYELGIPVVETQDRYHCNILQKVPLNMDRDNVTPAYLARVRAVVLEATRERLTKADATSTWVKEAIETHGDELADATIETVATLRFGEKRVAYDMSDPEANSLAVSQGYTVVHGGHLSKAEWDAVKRAKAILPAGQVAPSPKPYSEGGDPLKIVPPEKWTEAMRRTVDHMTWLADRLIGVKVVIQIANDITWPFAATYGRGSLVLNLGRLGYVWFTYRQEVHALLIHELAHHNGSGDHLSAKYHEELCYLGAKLTEIALAEPERFNWNKDLE